MNGEIFSILIPTWNNLPFLKICVDSIRKNSTYRHQIIVHVNDGSDGTLEWVRQQGLDYTTRRPTWACAWPMNMMRSKVKTDYMLFINDDMYALPEWDKALYDEIKALPDNRFFLSSTTIQPRTKGDSIINADYGDTPETFREQDLLNEVPHIQDERLDGRNAAAEHRSPRHMGPRGRLQHRAFARNVQRPRLHRQALSLRHKDDEGISASRVYHFETKSTTRIRKNMGQMQFLLKWGMTNSTFRRIFTYKGHDFDSRLTDSYRHDGHLKANILRGRLKALWWMLTKDFGPLLRSMYS